MKQSYEELLTADCQCHTVKLNNINVLHVKSEDAYCRIADRGARMLEWNPGGRGNIFRSSGECSSDTGSSGITDGISISWPWTGLHPASGTFPRNGTARSRCWALDECEIKNGVAHITYKHVNDEFESWPHRCSAEMRYVIGRKLSMELTTHNTDSECAVIVSKSLYGFLRVGSVKKLLIENINSNRFTDNTKSENMSGAGPVVPPGAAAVSDTDLHSGEVLVSDPVMKRRIRLEFSGAQSTILWNPGNPDGGCLTDMTDSDACGKVVGIDHGTGNINCIDIGPGEKHTLALTLSIEDL